MRNNKIINNKIINNIKFNKNTIIAHRGASEIAPENTLIAFQYAKNNNINWIEFDIQLTQDNIPVVIHDSNLDRTTNSRENIDIDINIDQIKYNDLKKLDAGSWFNQKFKSTKIPSFQETFEFCNNNNINLCIEIKTANTLEQKKILVDKICEIIKPYLDQKSNKTLNIYILISSFCFETLNLIRQTLPRIPIAPVISINNWKEDFEDKLDYYINLIKNLNATCLNINYHKLNKKKIEQLKKIVPHIIVWVVNNKKTQDTLFRLGVDAIISDKV